MIRVAELVGGLSLACDLGAGTTDEAALRTCVIATAVGRAVGAEPRDVYFASVLRYVGCSGYAHETAALGLGDDLAMLAALERVDARKPAEVVRAVAGMDGPRLARAGAVARIASDPKGFDKLATAHCEQAVALARTLGMSAAVAAALGAMHERWDGRGAPRAVRGAAIPLAARVLSLAHCAEVHHRLGGVTAAREAVRARAGGQLDPTCADAFGEVAAAIGETLAAPSVWDVFLDAEPRPHVVIDRARVPELALAFARYVDLKSPFTLGHSERVAELASAAADPDERDLVRTAALLHDLGRVTVPNGIWDKRGALNAAERERVRLHAYHTERWLARTPLLAPYAPIAGHHHERLDGSGYHRGARAGELSRAARLVAAADVHAALTADRPHRPAFDRAAAARVLADEASAGRLDKDAVRAILAAAGDDAPRIRAELPDGLSDREVEVLALLARGLANKEIGARLFISPRTVKNHIAHIYEKTGVSTRAAAALYAVTHGLT